MTSTLPATPPATSPRPARRPVARRVVLVLGTAFLAMVTTLLSVGWERRGPEQVAAGNLCGPQMDQICYVDALKGGFPLGYLTDNPNISVPDQLSFVEDQFDGTSFAIDVLVHWIVLLALALLVRRVIERALNWP